jgi:hypothetical protein
MAAALIQAFVQLEDANGEPRGGARAYTYTVGTTTPLTTYSDIGLTTPHANPVVADSEGVFAPIYAPTTANVKVVLKTSADVTLRTIEEVPTTATPAAGSVPASAIADNAITNAKLDNMATQRIKGRATGGTGDPEDLTGTQATAILDVFGADSGAGGVKGLVPATVAGDAAKALFGDGTFKASARNISSQTASASAQLDFVIDANYDYEFRLDRVCPTTDAVNLTMLFSVDNGATYLTTGTYSSVSSQLTTAVNGATSGTATSILLAGPIKNSAGFGPSGKLDLIVGGAAAYGTSVVGHMRYVESTGAAHVQPLMGGSNSTTSQVTNVRFIMSSGTIASGTIRQRAIPK